MDTYFLKNRIIEYAIPQLRQKGVGGIKVDEISSALGISKKTFYEVFDSKTAMIQSCAMWVIRDSKKHIDHLMGDCSKHPVERYRDLLHSYVALLYSSSTRSVLEFNRRYDLAEIRDETRRLWSEAFHQVLHSCSDYLLIATTHMDFVDIFMEILENVRLREDTQQKARILAYLLSRGLFNKEGLDIWEEVFRIEHQS